MIKYFKYAAIDFVLDTAGNPVFIEANDCAVAPYYIERKEAVSRAFTGAHPQFRSVNSNHLQLLVSCFHAFEKKFSNGAAGEKFIALICKRKNHYHSIKKEITFLLDTFRESGLQCHMYVPREVKVKDRVLTVKKSGLIPDVIFRRNFSFPDCNLAQPVVNSAAVRKIVSNKFLTHEIVTRCNPEIAQPESCYCTDRESLLQAAKALKDTGTDFIIKPNSSFGGKNFFYFDKREDLNAENSRKKIADILCLMNGGEYFIAQKRIETALFESADHRNYRYDLRVMVYDGKFAAIEGRRTKSCLKTKNRLSNIVSNINRGGKDLIVITGEEDGIHSVNMGNSFTKKACPDFSIDEHALYLEKKILKQIEKQAEAIVRQIDAAVAQTMQ